MFLFVLFLDTFEVPASRHCLTSLPRPPDQQHGFSWEHLRTLSGAAFTGAYAACG